MRLGIWLTIAISVCIGENLKHKTAVSSLPVVSQSSSFEIELKLRQMKFNLLVIIQKLMRIIALREIFLQINFLKRLLKIHV